MARGRLISRSLGSSRKFHALYAEAASLAEFCQALYPLLVAASDDFGRLEGDAFTVKRAVFPGSRRSERDFDRALDALHGANLVVRYRVEGEIYLQIVDFDRHQPNLHKRTQSRFPEVPGISGSAPEAPGNSSLARARGTENLELGTEPRTEGATAPGVGLAPPPDFDRDFWPLYPKKEGEQEARVEFAKLAPDTGLWNLMRAALERQCQRPQWQKDGGAFIPLAWRWLKGQRWKDELIADIGKAKAPRRAFRCPNCEMLHRVGPDGERKCTGTWDS